MKPIEIRKSILSLNKKSIANLSDAEMGKINGGLATRPTGNTTIPETLIGCPCTSLNPTDDTA